eukprot:c6932_g1_i2.p4 GENE.c6932_g1_i2~~c6932_g1_i2.p4  ORF type:complete len:101 (-),score=16.94 c6932_g1_i2:350-652(-)
MLTVGTMRLSIPFADSEHIEVHADTISAGFRLDFFRSCEQHYAAAQSIILGSELGRLLNKESEGVLAFDEEKVTVSPSLNQSNAILLIEHADNTSGRGLK